MISKNYEDYVTIRIYSMHKGVNARIVLLLQAFLQLSWEFSHSHLNVLLIYNLSLQVIVGGSSPLHSNFIYAVVTFCRLLTCSIRVTM